MARYVTQIRFYGEGDSRNYCASDSVTSSNLISGTIFTRYSPIIQLGIQTSPTIEYMEGGKEKAIRPSFYINGGVDSIQIGRTGIYELNLEGRGEIYQLNLSTEFVNAITKYNQQNAQGAAHVMIDLVYEG